MIRLPLNQYIDHTLLKADATENEIRKLCLEAIQYQFYAVCIQPTWVMHAKEFLQGSPVKVCSVVGFPTGAHTSETKAQEANQLASRGVDELDMVIHLGYLKSNEYEKVKEDIRAVVRAAPTALIKVIIETCLLTDEEKSIASALVVESGAHFVKTSTGFSIGGANAADVALLRKTVGPHFGVKASGGIRDWATAEALIHAGATRIGASALYGKLEMVISS